MESPRYEPVVILEDSEKEYLDIDYERLEEKRFYVVNYKGERIAIVKRSNNEIAFYGVRPK